MHNLPFFPFRCFHVSGIIHYEKALQVTAKGAHTPYKTMFLVLVMCQYINILANSVRYSTMALTLFVRDPEYCQNADQI